MVTLDEARDKVIWGRERKSAGYSQKDRETTAWHEAGHAILQVLLPDTDPLHKVTIIPRGRALGATMALPERDVLNKTKKQLLAEIRLCCGGRIAEEIFTGDVSTGAAQDIAQATAIARDMTCRYGMSEKFKNMTLGKGVLGNRGGEPSLVREFSEETQRYIDEEISRIMNERYEYVVNLLTEKKNLVEYIANRLVEIETMEGKEFYEIVENSKRCDDMQRQAQSEQ
jgi:cell division protease FtsH